MLNITMAVWYVLGASVLLKRTDVAAAVAAAHVVFGVTTQHIYKRRSMSSSKFY